jgi:Zn-dependent protease
MERDLLAGVFWYGAFLFSTICHEAAHAWSALRLGDDTAAKGGQVTLNPIPHIRREPIGMVAIPLLTWFSSGWIMGWASAPYSREWARLYPKRAALMALAGPATNLALAAAAALVIRMGFEWGALGPPEGMSMQRLATTGGSGAGEYGAEVLSILLSLNLLLCVFNLMPVPPLDGSQAPLLFLPPSAADAYMGAMRSPIIRMAGLFGAWKLIPLVFPHLLRTVAGILYL